MMTGAREASAALSWLLPSQEPVAALLLDTASKTGLPVIDLRD
jgi:hypothetical protein